MTEESDSWEDLKPTDVLSKLPANFYEQIESPKWSERKECLEILLKLITDNPRLDPASNYGEIVSVLKKILSKDANINVVAVAAKVLAGLASGLRKKFTQFVPMFVPIILEKFKEKKPLVATPCAEAIDALAKTTTLETISEDVLAALDNKTPSVRVQTALFLTRSFSASTTTTLNKKLLKIFCVGLVKNVTSPDPEVRDSSSAALGAAMKVVGEMNIMPFLSEIKDDHLKIEKIKDYCDKTVLVRPICTTNAASNATASSSSSVGAAVVQVEPETDPWEFLQPTNVLSALPTNFYEQLESPKWSERKECLEILLKQINDNPRLDPASNYGEIVSVLKKILSKDANINVVAVAANVLAGIASGLRKKFAQFVPMFVPVIFEKFKEKKPLVAMPCADAIDALAKTTTLEAISEDVLTALDNKTPSVKIQTAMFLTRSFSASTPTILNKKLLKIFCAGLVKNINCPDPEVRDSSAAALGAAMKVVGEKNIMPFLIEVKEDHLKMEKIKEYCDKTVLKASPQVNEQPVVSSEVAVPVQKNVVKSVKPKEIVEKSVPVVQKIVKTEVKQEFVPVEEETDAWEYLQPIDVLSKLPSNFYEQIESPKWSERKECLEILLKLINDNPRLDPASNYGEIVSVLKKILSKDANINVVAVAAKILAGVASGLRKKFTQFVPMFVPIILEKFKEKKPLVAMPCAEAIDALAKITTLEAISEDVLSALDNKTPSVRVQTAMFLTRSFSASSPTTLTKKLLKLYCVGLVKNITSPDPEVRDSTSAALGAAMKVVGEVNIMPFLSEIKEDHLKIEKIKEYCEKTVLLRPVRATSSASNATASSSSEGVTIVQVEPETDPWEFLQPTNVLSALPTNFYEQLESPKWSERKECLEILLKQINDNPRLDPASNYGELVGVLKKILTKDANINVVAVAANVLAGVASGLRKKFAQFAPMFVPIIFEKFKEKKPLVATPCAEAIDALAKTTTLEAISEDVLTALDNKTPSVKVQTALFLTRSFTASTPTILNKKLLKILCAGLVKTITSPDPEVRDSCAAALGAAMKVVGEKNLMPFLIEVKEDHLKMEKIKEYCEKTVLKYPNQGNLTVSSSEAAVSVPKAVVRPKGNGEKAVAVAAQPIEVKNDKTKVEKPGESGVRSKKTETFDGSALIDTKQKMQRFQEEKSLKVLRWSFNVPTEEHVEQLKNQMSTICKPALHVQLFHTDFKQYLKALETLTQCIETSSDATINSLDLLLKWCTLRFFETNPSVLLKSLEYIQSAFTLCVERGNVELHDIEVNSFVPYLLLKSGEPKEPVRLGVRQILEKMCKLYPTSKLFPMIIEGCKTKNSRQKAECLEQLGSLIELYGIVVCGQPASTSLKAIAVNIGDRDNSVRNAALNAIVAAYMHVGDRVYKLVGTINEKDFRMLEERIKRTAKNRLVIKPTAQLNEIEDKKVTGGASARGKSPAAPRQQLQCTENGQETNADQKRAKQQAPGMFQLDLDKIGANEDVPEDSYRMPKLRDNSEIDDILKIPMNVPRAIKLRPSSPAKRVSQNLDAVTMLDTAISQVTSSSMGTSIQALVQLDEIIKDPSKSHFLAGKIDQLLMAVYFQLRMAYNSHMNDNTVQQNDVVRLYRHLCVVLLSLCSAGNLVKEASEGSLKDLVCQLLTVLVDERLNYTNEGAELIRSINILIVNLVTNTEHTACLVALMRLLRDTMHSQTASAKFQQLVMKCIWKLSKNLSNFADKLQIDKILLEAHQFFVDFPVSTWKTRPSDTPSRTVKTILNTLCQIYADKILDYVGSIEQPESSEAVQYLKKCLRDICAKPPTTSVQLNGQQSQISTSSVDLPIPPVNENGEGQTNDAITSDEQIISITSQPGSRVLNKFTRAELTEIFKKVGSKEKTKEGLSELYDFIQAHPGTDIDMFYKKASPFFQNYIQKHLKRIGEERGQMTQSASSVKETEVTNGVTVSDVESVNLLENLQKLRANCGLAPAGLNTPKIKGKDDNSDFTLPQVRSGVDLNAETKKSSDLDAESTADDIDILKKRLEKIKRGAL